MASMYSKKETITYKEYTVLVGLMVLAIRAYQEEERIADVIREIVGEDENGYTTEEIWSGSASAADSLLQRNNIKVLPPIETPKEAE